MTRVFRTRSVGAARSFRALVVGALLAGALTACGGAESSSGGVAAIEEGSGSDGSSSSTSPTASGDAEQQLLDYVECLRSEGLDVPDPTVDAEGNLTLRPPGGVAGGQPINREQFQKAQETCGQPPEGALGITEEDRSELQDAALEFAKCLRGEGIDVPDPDFSEGGLGGAGGQGPFGDLNTDEPKVAAAVEKCQSAFGDLLPGGGQ
ncbi:MAG: hypothetical protein ACRCYX_15610 [Dermatophilaceae bacterium]